MNDLSLENYCNLLFKFLCFSKESRDFFADVSSFSVISDNFDLRRHSMSFNAIPQDPQNQIRNCFLHVGVCSDKVLVVIEPIFTYLRLPTYILFLRHFCWPALGQLIPWCTWSPIFKLLVPLNHSSASYKWYLVRKLWCFSLWIFMF